MSILVWNLLISGRGAKNLALKDSINNQCCQNFEARNCNQLAFLLAGSDFKVTQFLSKNHKPNFTNFVLFSNKIIRITQLGGKTITLVT